MKNVRIIGNSREFSKIKRFNSEDNMDLIVFSVPVNQFRYAFEKAIPFIDDNTIIVNTSRGREKGTKMTVSQIAKILKPDVRLVSAFGGKVCSDDASLARVAADTLNLQVVDNISEEMTFHITTFGCQMNEHDSEIMAGLLTRHGLKQVKDRKDANLILINTCSIRENAHKRFFGTLGQLKKKKMAQRDDVYIGLCGCMMQQDFVIDQVKEKYPWVDLIFGTHNIEKLPELLDKAIYEKKRQIQVLEDRQSIPEGLPAKRLYRHKSYVNITFGCNNFCTYCIVPYTRGRERSRRAEDILTEIKGLAADGVKEVMLLGQNVNSYLSCDGKDFADLIYMIQDIDGIERIRFMTSHPKDLSDKLIQAYVDCPKLCKNIHLPVQSGSSAVLKRMNRKYDREKYLDLVEKLRKAVPGITMSTDIIVGFPGETEEDFKDTLSLVEQVRYDSAFTFLYSIRKGTPAEQYSDQIPEEVKHERFNRLVDLVNSISEEKNSKYVGKIEKVLVEGPSKTGSSTYMGRTEGFKLVNFKADESLVGKIIDVKITSSNTFSLEGEVCQILESKNTY
ncbi:MAG: tRNA (N6-isopentenyl adenosine(37)-C2)-methylthiotransferase MiaB [Clostridia bacterium]|nr:tRNA (N6-isopentenyl adenosine(37)-C2)-methylthiotransferase MiaB [Clostridia bacterium]